MELILALDNCFSQKSKKMLKEPYINISESAGKFVIFQNNCGLSEGIVQYNVTSDSTVTSLIVQKCFDDIVRMIVFTHCQLL